MDLVSTIFSENFVEKICKANDEVVAYFTISKYSNLYILHRVEFSVTQILREINGRYLKLVTLIW